MTPSEEQPRASFCVAAFVAASFTSFDLAIEWHMAHTSAEHWFIDNCREM
jgi:hypothetical protein